VLLKMGGSCLTTVDASVESDLLEISQWCFNFMRGNRQNAAYGKSRGRVSCFGETDLSDGIQTVHL
jgi:hypothetical protein